MISSALEMVSFRQHRFGEVLGEAGGVARDFPSIKRCQTGIGRWLGRGCEASCCLEYFAEVGALHELYFPSQLPMSQNTSRPEALFHITKRASHVFPRLNCAGLPADSRQP